MAVQTVTVAEGVGGSALGTVVREATGLAWSAVRKLCERGKVTVNGVPVTDAGERVRAGATVQINPEAQGTGRGAVTLDRARLVYLDAHVVVVDKPPGINTVPYEPGERGTLVDLLGVSLHRWGLAPATAPLFVVHRLDRETSGVLVFGRTWTAKRHLADLFRRHDLQREYLALAHGSFSSARTITSEIAQDRGDGLRGTPRSSRTGGGLRAITHVRPLAFLPREGGVTLVGCTLETGRQHQIRIHLSESGHPVLGERVYVREFRYPMVPAPRMMLHARMLGFAHPAREGEILRFEVPLPEDVVTVAKRLGWTGNLEG